MDRSRPRDDSDLEVLLQHREFVHRLARWMVRDAHAADDVEQQAWLAVLRGRPKPMDDPRPWLARVVRSWVARRARTRSRAETREKSARVRPAPEPPDRIVARADLHRFLANAVMDLGEPYRTALILHHFEELPVAEVARRMDTPLETTRTRLRRGRARLRERLEEHEREHGSDWRAALLLLLGPLDAPERSGPLVASGLAMATLGVGVAGLGFALALLGEPSRDTETDGRLPIAAPLAGRESAGVGTMSRVRDASPARRPSIGATTVEAAGAGAALELRPARRLAGPSGWVDAAHVTSSVVVAPSGDVAVTTSSDGHVRWRSFPDGRTIRDVATRCGPLSCSAVTADGVHLLTGGEDGVVRVWDLRSGEGRGAGAEHAGRLRRIAIAGDGRIASSDLSGAVVLWRVGDPERRRTDTPRGYARDLAFAPDGRRLFGATPAYDGVLVLDTDADTWRTIPATSGTHGRVVLPASDGVSVWTARKDGVDRVRLDGEVLQRLDGLPAEITALCAAGEGALLVAGTRSGYVTAWDARSGAAVWTERPHERDVMSIAAGPSGRTVVAAFAAGSSLVLDATTGVTRAGAGANDAAWYLSGVALDPFDRFVVTSAFDGHVRVRPLDGGAVRRLAGHTDRVIDVDVSPDGDRLASASHDGTARIWDRASGACMRVLRGHSDLVGCVTFDAEGRRLLTGSQDRTVALWDVETGARLRRLVGHDDEVRDAVFVSDRHVATACEDGAVRIWDLDEAGVDIREPRSTLWRGGDIVTSLDVSRDGSLLAAASHDGVVRVWRLADGRLLHQLTGHVGWVHEVTFAGDGARIVSAGNDHTLRVWDLGDGGNTRLAAVLRGHSAAVDGVAVARDGRSLVSGGWDKRLLLWELP